MEALLLAVLVCDVGGPGNATQAQPVVDKFLRHLETTGGWKPNTMRGVYHNDPERCQDFYRSSKPALVALDLPTYLEERKAWGLRPVAHMGGAGAKRYYLLVKKGSYTHLRQLAGKKLVTSLDHNPRFLYRVVLANRVPNGHFQLVHSRRPLKGLRQVARGKADATIVDEAAFAYLSELKLPNELVAIYSSKPMPGLTLALTANDPKEQTLERRVAPALPKLCAGAGVELCKTFGVKKFEKAKPAVYKALERQYR